MSRGRLPVAYRFVLLCLGTLSNVLSAACLNTEPAALVIDSPVLTVATLNVAHGRNDSFNQMFLSRKTIQQNLSAVATQLRAIGAHVVALQEADGVSGWSGKFDHVTFLAEQMGYPCYFHGLHDQSRYSRYGTALLSQYPLQDPAAHHFDRSWPTKPKGFSVATIGWNPDNRLATARRIAIVSVHLDFSRAGVRQKQVAEMTRYLATIEGPLIVLGDFNDNGSKPDSAVMLLAENLALHAYQPTSPSLGTYGRKGKRLDWILISAELAFHHYRVVQEPVSDHLAVVAKLVLRQAGQIR